MPMLPVSAAELASIQSDAVSAVCDKTCQIWRDLTPNTPDAYGSSSSSRDNTANYTLMHTTVAGMRQPTGGELANFDFLIGDKIAWTVLFPYGTDVQHRDHLVIEGSVLEAHVTLEPHSYPALLAVVAAQIK